MTHAVKLKFDASGFDVAAASAAALSGEIDPGAGDELEETHLRAKFAPRPKPSTPSRCAPDANSSRTPS